MKVLIKLDENLSRISDDETLVIFAIFNKLGVWCTRKLVSINARGQSL